MIILLFDLLILATLAKRVHVTEAGFQPNLNDQFNFLSITLPKKLLVKTERDLKTQIYIFLSSFLQRCRTLRNLEKPFFQLLFPGQGRDWRAGCDLEQCQLFPIQQSFGLNFQQFILPAEVITDINSSDNTTRSIERLTLKCKSDVKNAFVLDVHFLPGITSLNGNVMIISMATSYHFHHGMETVNCEIPEERPGI